MSDLPISGLPSAGALTGIELLPVVQSGATKQTTLADVLTYIEANIAAGVTSIDGLSDAKTDYPNDNLYIGQGVGAAVIAAGNTAMGSLALQAAAQYANTAIGSSALRFFTGTSNTAIGAGSQQVIVTGDQNTSLGWNSMAAADGGANNTVIGAGTAAALTSGAENTILGSLSNVSGATVTNEITIGFSTVGKGSNTARLGNSSTTDIYFGNDTAILHGNGSVLSGLPTVIGAGATSSGTNPVAIGASSFAGSHGTALGDTANAGVNAVAIGYGSLVGARGIGIGKDATATADAIAIGDSSTASTSFAGQFGSTSFTNLKIGGNSGSIQTGNTTNTSSAPWILGQLFTQAVTPDATQYLEVMVGGSVKKLIVAA